MPVVQAFWNKLNGNEKFIGYGAVLIIIAFLAATAGGRSGDVMTSIIGAILIFVILWLKYSTMKIPWPVPVSTVVLGIAAVLTVLALLNLLPALSAITQLYGIALLLNLIGCGVMAFGAWKEYQATLPKPGTPAAPPAA
jgi:hypothetical protein